MLELGSAVRWTGLILVGALVFSAASAEEKLELESEGRCLESSVSSEDRNLQDLLNAVKDDRPQAALALAQNSNLSMLTDQGETLLHLAVLCRSSKVLRTLLKIGYNPNVRNSDNVTPLWYATALGDVQLIEELHDKEADVLERSCKLEAHCENDTLLHSASTNGYVDVVEYLLKSGIDVDTRNDLGESALHKATQNSRLGVVNRLLKHGAIVNARNNEGETPLHLACEKGDIEMVNMLIEKEALIQAKDAEGLTPLHKAAEGGHVDVVEQLLRTGVRYTGVASALWSPLHLATLRGHLSVVKHLLQHGFDVNERIYDGSTPLHWSVYTSHEIGEELIKNGAALDIRAALGKTPLHIAADRGNNYPLLEALVSAGADVNARDFNDRTALHYATRSKDLAGIKLLLEGGSAVDTKDIDGETPLTWAISRGNTPVIDLLVARSATHLS